MYKKHANDKLLNKPATTDKIFEKNSSFHVK